MAWHLELHMQASTRIEIPQQLGTLLMLAQLLERLERSEEPVGADQYRSVVRHLAIELGTVEPDESFESLLNAFPATSELYKNLHYVQAGLCRSLLDASLKAEIEATAVLAFAARPTVR